MSRPQEFRSRLRAEALTLAGRMDWYRGLRAATALSTPLLLADLTGLSHMGWAALGGIEAIVTDAGGPYRSRLGRLTVLTLGGALGVFLGTLAGSDLRWALPATLAFCFLWTYLAVLGQPFASAGLLVQVIYICGIGEPVPSLREALLRAAFLLAGGLWAMALSLFLWPLDPYRPARTAVAKCYEALAAFLASVGARQDPGQAGSESGAEGQADPETNPEQWHRANLVHKSQLRRLLEAAWDAVASVRAESLAETAQGRQLIVLLESADLILERAVALGEHTVALAESPGGRPAAGGASPAQLQSQLPSVRQAALEVAGLLIQRRLLSFGKARSEASQSAASSRRAELAASLAAFQPQSETEADAYFEGRQMAEIASNLDTALETAEALLSGNVPEPANAATPSPAARAPKRWDAQTVWSQLAANWQPKSLLLRHAARVALVCGFDVCLIEERHVGHGYWLIMTSLIVLQPHVSGTLRKSLQRVAGTVGGGVLAALLAVSLHSQLVTGIVLFPLALLSLALLPVSYAWFSFFLTPTFVLALLRHTGDWQLAALRVGNTIAGAAIAIAAMTVLFPSYERERIALYLRAGLAANRLYVEELLRFWRTAGEDKRALARARRATGLAHNDMEESLERVLAETWARKTSGETLLAVAAYLHRVSQTVTGLASLPGADEWKRSPEVQARLAAVRDRLGWLEERLVPATSRHAGPWPATAARREPDAKQAGQSLPGRRQLARLERQTHVLHRHLESIRAASALGQASVPESRLPGIGLPESQPDR